MKWYVQTVHCQFTIPISISNIINIIVIIMPIIKITVLLLIKLVKKKNNNKIKILQTQGKGKSGEVTRTTN